MSLLPQVNIIIPLYNEEEVFDSLISRIKDVLDNLTFSCQVILINDGSSDSTEELIEKICAADNRFIGILLSRNFGHQLALSAGYKEANATEAVFVIDGDLQDPPELINDFYKKYLEGYDVVYGVRKKRKEGFLKRFFYKAFYRFQSKITNISIPLDSGDFGLVSRRVLDVLNNMPEQSRYLRGMRAWIGYKQFGLEYERMERTEGESKYSISKLIELAFNGIFNFSDYPIRFISRMGILAISTGFLYFIYVVIKKLFFAEVIEGFTSLLFFILILGGIQLLSIGIIGEYIMRIFFQTKDRPLYLIKKIIGKNDK